MEDYREQEVSVVSGFSRSPETPVLSIHHQLFEIGRLAETAYEEPLELQIKLTSL